MARKTRKLRPFGVQGLARARKKNGRAKHGRRLSRYTMRLPETHRFQHNFFHLAQFDELVDIQLTTIPIATPSIGKHQPILGQEWCGAVDAVCAAAITACSTLNTLHDFSLLFGDPIYLSGP